MASIAQTRTAWRPARAQVGLLALLLLAAAVAWVLTRERMLGMDAGPGTDPGGLGFYVVSWVVMMAAMMFPSITPMVLTFAFIQRRRRERGALESVVSRWIFVAGYLVTWTVFGLAAYGLFVGIRSLSIPELSWHRGGRYLAGAVLLAAAAYQLTPTKDACLRRCRGTLDFLTTQWREGAAGALRMGIVHGGWCVGCCWALMGSLFALGLMSVTWMIVIAALIAAEKLLPSKALANRSVATVLLILGLGVALFPNDVPALTLPGSRAATHAMHNMGMGSTSRHGAAKNAGAMPGMGQHSGAMPSLGTHGGAMPSMGKHGGAMPSMGKNTGAMPGGAPQSHR
jgi:predicted metal-binding membrane protein